MSVETPQRHKAIRDAVEARKKRANTVLKDLVDPFRGEPEEFFCPVLEFLLREREKCSIPEKCSIEGVLILQDWGNNRESKEDAVKIVEQAARATCRDPKAAYDDTLFNLLGKGSKWHVPLLDNGWIALNAVWGTRKQQDKNKFPEKSGVLPATIHYPALEIWGGVICDVHEICTFETIVLAGSWARFGIPKEVSGKLKASDYFEEWCLRLSWGRRKSLTESAKVAKTLKALQGVTIYLATHPSTWAYGYSGESGPPCL